MSTTTWFGKDLSPGSPPIIIAELSGNHNGSKVRAMELIHAAKASGADVVKLQTYTADTITMDADGPWFRIPSGPWAGRRLYDLYQEASTPWEWHAELVAEAKKINLPWFSSPFDPTAVRFLEELSCPVYKVASFEVVDIPLLECIGKTRKPVIMSVGMSTLEEIDLAMNTLRCAGAEHISLLHCISAYPAPSTDMRLSNLAYLRQRYAVPVGLSDHSRTNTAAITALGLGAQIIEKHICLRRDDGGPDAAFSLEPHEFASLVQASRDVVAMMSVPAHFGPLGDETGSVVFRKSLFASRDISAGQTIERAHIRVVRPGHGLKPKELPAIIGKKARLNIARGTPLSWDLLL